MARKNVFNLIESDVSPQVDNEPAFANSRPLAGFEKPLKRASPVGAISQSLGGVHEKAQRVDALEKQLAQGQAIVELDTAVLDSSFVVDRLGVSSQDQALLVSQIREHGQQVPILVRPHPEREGRFQVAYGHRRLAAIKTIGGPIRAVIRDLTDEQLVVSQGQENNARTDLTFIERAFFASRLEGRNFSRDVIMSALGVDKGCPVAHDRAGKPAACRTYRGNWCRPRLWPDALGRACRSDRRREPEAASARITSAPQVLTA